MTGSGMGDEFEDASLVDMHTMIVNARPQDLLDRAVHLLGAAEEFISIGEGLASHIQHVEWTGEGADAFREWTHQLAKDTVGLGEYTSAVSSHMLQAGVALSEAKSTLPPIPSDATLCYTDPAKESKAAASLEAARQEAIPVMNRLASTYRVSAEGLNSLTPPTFKPLPEAITDPLNAGTFEGERRLVPTEGSTGAGSLRVPVTGGGERRPPGVTPSVAESRSVSTEPPAEVRTHLDAQQVRRSPEDAGALIYSPSAPARAVPHDARVVVGNFPGSFQAPSALPHQPQDPGIVGGQRIPATGGHSARSALPSSPLGDEGIVGGIPVSTRNPAPQYPRGVVVGEEPVLTGPTTPGGSAPRTGGWGSQGVVGGESPGAPSGPAEFVPGSPVQQAHGTGGVGPGGYPMAPGATAGPGVQSRRARPDYLVEDEETWKPKRHVVPPVIG